MQARADQIENLLMGSHHLHSKEEVKVSEEEVECGKFFLLPNYYPGTFQPLKDLLVGYLQIEDPKSWQFVELIRKILGANLLLERPELISFQPL